MCDIISYTNWRLQRRDGTIYRRYIIKPEILALYPSYLLYRYRIDKIIGSILYRYCIMKKKMEVNYCIVIVSATKIGLMSYPYRIRKKIKVNYRIIIVLVKETKI